MMQQVWSTYLLAVCLSLSATVCLAALPQASDGAPIQIAALGGDNVSEREEVTLASRGFSDDEVENDPQPHAIVPFSQGTLQCGGKSLPYKQLLLVGFHRAQQTQALNILEGRGKSSKADSSPWSLKIHIYSKTLCPVKK
jgi:hypothetical protein